MPTATHDGLRQLGHVAGSAAALQRCMQMVAASVFGTLGGMAGGQPLVAMATAMLAASVLALVFFWGRQRASLIEAKASSIG